MDTTDISVASAKMGHSPLQVFWVYVTIMPQILSHLQPSIQRYKLKLGGRQSVFSSNKSRPYGEQPEAQEERL